MKHTGPRQGAPIAAALILLLALAPGMSTAEPLGPSLCALLKQLIPQVKTYQPAGAKAQLVMALVEKYEENAQLRQVWSQIDPITSATCPKERAAMLGIVKTPSLAEALR